MSKIEQAVLITRLIREIIYLLALSLFFNASVNL